MKITVLKIIYNLLFYKIRINKEYKSLISCLHEKIVKIIFVYLICLVTYKVYTHMLLVIQVYYVGA